MGPRVQLFVIIRREETLNTVRRQLRQRERRTAVQCQFVLEINLPFLVGVPASATATGPTRLLVDIESTPSAAQWDALVQLDRHRPLDQIAAGILRFVQFQVYR